MTRCAGIPVESNLVAWKEQKMLAPNLWPKATFESQFGKTLAPEDTTTLNFLGKTYHGVHLSLSVTAVEGVITSCVVGKHNVVYSDPSLVGVSDSVAVGRVDRQQHNT